MRSINTQNNSQVKTTSELCKKLKHQTNNAKRKQQQQQPEPEAQYVAIC